VRDASQPWSLSAHADALLCRTRCLVWSGTRGGTSTQRARPPWREPSPTPRFSLACRASHLRWRRGWCASVCRSTGPAAAALGRLEMPQQQQQLRAARCAWRALCCRGICPATATAAAILDATRCNAAARILLRILPTFQACWQPPSSGPADAADPQVARSAGDSQLPRGGCSGSLRGALRWLGVSRRLACRGISATGRACASLRGDICCSAGRPVSRPNGPCRRRAVQLGCAHGLPRRPRASG